MVRSSALAWLLCALVGIGSGGIGCKGSDNAPGDDDTSMLPDGSVDPDGGGPGVIDAGPESDAFVPPADSYSLTWGPVLVQPGEEDTRCVTLRLGNPGQIHVGQIHNALTGGSHHLIVYRTNDTAEVTTPVHCNPFTSTLDPAKGSPLMITQRHDETLQLPEGVAFTLAANQMIRLEMHFINTSDAPLDVSSVSTFVPMADAQFQNEADFLFIGTPDITIPAMTTKTIGPVFFPMPAELNGVSYFAITGHTHKFGLNVHIATAASASSTTTSIYEHPDWLWSEPDTTYFDPPFTLPTNGGFKFSCDYNNTSNQSVSFGESANDEMCFFWSYYYPSKGSRVCVHTNQFGGGGGTNACCPGNQLVCAFIQQYLGN